MIFTSVAAALLAAVTGVTTVRVPGGQEQEIPVEPACVCELTVANLTDYMSMMRTLKRLNFGTPFPKGNQNTQDAASIVATIAREMRSVDFEPTYLSFYNVYEVEKAPFRPRLNPFVGEHYEETLAYSVISFSDFRNENSKSFVFGDFHILSGHTFEGDVVPIMTPHNNISKNTVTLLSDAFLACGYKDVAFGKWYCSDDENEYPGTMVNTDHWEVEDFLGENINNPTGDDDWWKAIIWYEEWKRLQDMFTIGNGEPGVSHTHVWIGDDRIISSPIAGVIYKFALEESDFLAGNYALDASIVGNQLHAASAMDYGQLLELNDLIVL